MPSGLLKVSWGDFAVWARMALYGRGTPAMDQLGVAADFDSEAKEVDRWVNLELRWARMLSPRLRLLMRATLGLYDFLASNQASSWTTFGGGDGPEGVDLADFTFMQVERAGSRSGDFEAQATWDWLGDGRFPLMLGAVARLRRFHDGTTYSTTDGVPFETSNTYDVEEWQVAVYVQQRARLLDPAAERRSPAGPAERVSAPTVAAGGPGVDGAVGRAGQAVINSAFRSPSGFERFAQYPPFQVRNPGLQPEGVLTGELGYEQRIASWWWGSSLTSATWCATYLPSATRAAASRGTKIKVHCSMWAVTRWSRARSASSAMRPPSLAQSTRATSRWSPRRGVGNARVSWQGALARLSLASTFSGRG